MDTLSSALMNLSKAYYEAKAGEQRRQLATASDTPRRETPAFDAGAGDARRRQRRVRPGRPSGRDAGLRRALNEDKSLEGDYHDV